MARKILGFDEVRVSNLIGIPTYRSGGLSEVAAEQGTWLAYRSALSDALFEASAVLLAYGISPPTGPARHHFRQQVNWLEVEIKKLSLPVYWVGGAPRHPSRWQRYTFRTFSGEAFFEALGRALVERKE
ncbi:MAG: hypothetical protein EOO27_33660 [Comamonadaceae bacterium]|nr:MAG: hypothetical protein EOO27_33660 [Comamonadaceae bacterium]